VRAGEAGPALFFGGLRLGVLVHAERRTELPIVMSRIVEFNTTI
jgi:hypothetical protein